MCATILAKKKKKKKEKKRICALPKCHYKLPSSFNSSVFPYPSGDTFSSNGRLQITKNCSNTILFFLKIITIHCLKKINK